MNGCILCFDVRIHFLFYMNLLAFCLRLIKLYITEYIDVATIPLLMCEDNWFMFSIDLNTMCNGFMLSFYI